MELSADSVALGIPHCINAHETLICYNEYIVCGLVVVQHRNTPFRGTVGSQDDQWQTFGLAPA